MSHSEICSPQIRFCISKPAPEVRSNSVVKVFRISVKAACGSPQWKGWWWVWCCSAPPPLWPRLLYSAPPPGEEDWCRSLSPTHGAATTHIHTTIMIEYKHQLDLNISSVRYLNLWYSDSCTRVFIQHPFNELLQLATYLWPVKAVRDWSWASP